MVSRCEMNALPCGMIRMAKLRWPRRERSWCLVQHGARRKLDIKRLMRFSFSMGSEAWNWLVSSVNPKKLEGCGGGPLFSQLTGGPRGWRKQTEVC